MLLGCISFRLILQIDRHFWIYNLLCFCLYISFYLTLFYVNTYCIDMYAVVICVCFVYASWVDDLLVIIEYT